MSQESSDYRNKIIHDPGPTHFPGPYRVTNDALKAYANLERKNFGTTTIVQPGIPPYRVKDYHYRLEDGSVGMTFLPINDYGPVTNPDGSQGFASEVVDAELRRIQNLCPEDMIYALIYFIHPEQHSGSIAQLANPETSAKIQMGTTHMGAYLGQGKTSNAPPMYHNRDWGVVGDPGNGFGYPANVMTLSLDGVDQATLNRNLHLADAFLNYGVRFPFDYQNSQFLAVDINTALMFYKDWIMEESYLKTEEAWFTYCAAHKTIVATIGLNLPHNEASFKEVYGDEEGEKFWKFYVTNYFQVLGWWVDDANETDFEPLWKKQGLTRDQIRPFTLKEYNCYSQARRDGDLDKYIGFQPVAPPKGVIWKPQATADIIFDFIDVYADFVDAGAVTSVSVTGFYSKVVSDRMGISLFEYFFYAVPLMMEMMLAEAKVGAMVEPAKSPKESAWFKQTLALLTKGLTPPSEHGQLKKQSVGSLDSAWKDLKLEHKLPAVKVLDLSHVKALAEKLAGTKWQPEVLAWLCMFKVITHWKELMGEKPMTRLEAYDWLRESMEGIFAAATNITVTDPDKIQFNVPPAIAHMIETEMFDGTDPLISFKTVFTVMNYDELELVADQDNAAG